MGEIGTAPIMLPSPSKTSNVNRSTIVGPHPSLPRTPVGLTAQIIKRSCPCLLGILHLLGIADGIGKKPLERGIEDEIETFRRPHVAIPIIDQRWAAVLPKD